MIAREPSVAVLPFLGARQYLHGTTLYRCLRQCTPAGAAATCFRISRMITSNAVEVTQDGSPDGCDARLDWEGGLAVVRQLPAREPIARENYDESLIASQARVDGDSSSYEGASPFDAVATAVPLFKALLAARGLTPSGGQWMFTRLDTTSEEEPFRTISVTLEQHLPRRIAKSVIALDTRKFAHFYFSWVASAPLESNRK